jgi:GT2 family glycosyltransferase
MVAVGIVVIGRNEGERLKACLRSVVSAGPVIYVDSGSTDGSQDFARSLGIEVVALAVPPNFTAARARNAGAKALFAKVPETEFVQLVDGDCEVTPGWVSTATATLERDSDLAAVFGRLRERHPDRSIYNALADDEWNVPIGEVGAIPGNVMIRRAAFEQAGGYSEDMIAGEEPDMSIRMRAAGYRLLRIDAEMALHDVAMTRFRQWWTRSRRTGHAFAELAHRHPTVRWPDWRANSRRILLWGGALPSLVLAGLLLAFFDVRWLGLPLLLAAGWALNIGRLYRRRLRDGLKPHVAQASAMLLMVGKLPEFLGLVRFHLNRVRKRRSGLIEYKQ